MSELGAAVPIAVQEGVSQEGTAAIVKPSVRKRRARTGSKRGTGGKPPRSRTRTTGRSSKKRPTSLKKKRSKLGRLKRRLRLPAGRGRAAIQPLAPEHEGRVSAEAIEEAYARGLEQGRYEGGEMLLEHAAPPGLLLADVDLRHVIALGVEAVRPSLMPLLGTEVVWQEMEQALNEGRPHAVVRLGDGELLALAHDTVFDAATTSRQAPFLSYAGIDVPDHGARDQLADAVRRANLVGVPISRKPHYQPLLVPALRSHGIELRSLRVTDSTINYSLYLAGLLTRLLQGRRILAVGNEAAGMAEKLTGFGLHVSGIITPVRGFPDIERVLAEARSCEFDIALVSAGIPAVVIATRMAAELGKVALDFGHMANQIMEGKVLL